MSSLYVKLLKLSRCFYMPHLFIYLFIVSIWLNFIYLIVACLTVYLVSHLNVVFHILMYRLRVCVSNDLGGQPCQSDSLLTNTFSIIALALAYVQ